MATDLTVGRQAFNRAAIISVDGSALENLLLLSARIAEPLRNLGRYTFTDVVAMRLRQTPVRVAAATGSLAVVSFYLIAQMVGAGNLVRLLIGINYATAVTIVGVVMLAYVLFGGMICSLFSPVSPCSKRSA